MSSATAISLIRSVNIIQDTVTSYGHEGRNQELLESVGRINLTELTESEVKELGWPKWSDELPFVMIPFYLYDFLEYDQTVACIDGTEIMVAPGYDKSGSGYIDNDHRGGYLAYGFYPKKDS